MKNIEGTYFDSVFHTENMRQMTLGQYIDKVRSHEFASQITRLRELMKAGKKQEAVEYKKKLPLFVVGGVMKGGRRLEHLLHYSQCLCIDIDNSPVSPEEIRRIAEKLSYVKAGHVSPSGTGYKLFVTVDSSLAQHAQAFETVRCRLEKEIPGIQVDISGKDANRGCFVSHDPLAFMKEETECLKISTAEAESVEKNKLKKSALELYISKFERNNAFLDGQRHLFIVKLAAQLNHAGFPLDEVVEECRRRYSSTDFSIGEIEKTVRDIYTRYRTSHATQPYAPKEERDSEKSSKSSKNSYSISEKNTPSDEEDEEADIELNESLLPHFSKAIYDQLPDILSDTLKPAKSQDERDIMLLAGMVLFSSVMNNVSGSLGRHEHFPCFYAAVIGPSGSGKGCVAAMHKMVEPWQQHVYEESRRQVKEYEKRKREYDLYIQNWKQSSRKNPKLPLDLPDEPEVVKQKNLNIFGYITLARFLELLQDNDPYISCLFETEMEALIQTMGQDFGGYGYLLNQAAHHERAGSDSKMSGPYLVGTPKLALFVTGTDGMFKQLVPSTENGTFSRLMIYKLIGNSAYRKLTSEDDTRTAADYFGSLGKRVLDIALHLEQSPTWVKFTDAQRKRIDRFFEREYNQVRAFDNEDLSSSVLRNRLAVFRIASTLTGLRKGERHSWETNCTIEDRDVDIALEMAKVCLKHSYVVSTTLQRPQKKARYKFPYNQQKFFADLPEKFKWGELIEEARVRKIAKTSLFRMVKKCESIGLLVSLGAGYYQKTEEGKTIVAPEIP